MELLYGGLMAEQPETGSTRTSDVAVQLVGTMRRATVAALLLLIAILATYLASAVFRFENAIPRWLFWILLLSPVSAIVTSILGRLRFQLGNSLRVEGGKVVFGDQGGRRVSKGDFKDGWLSPQEKRIHFQTVRGDVYSARVEDNAYGQQLLVATDLDVSKRKMFLTLGTTGFLTALCAFLGLVSAGTAGPWVAALFNIRGPSSFPFMLGVYVLQFFVVHALFGPASLVIGADGVIVKSVWRERFVAFREIRSLETDDRHVTFFLHDKSKVRARARHLDTTIQDAIQQRVNEALRLNRDRSMEPGALAQLDKGTQTTVAWRKALSALLKREGSYRGAQLTRDQLLDVLENPGAHAERRIGAALALFADGDAEAVRRIRVAAGAAANEKVRIALEKIASGETESRAIEEAAEAEQEALVRERSRREL